jgi:hypothetical protein
VEPKARASSAKEQTPPQQKAQASVTSPAEVPKRKTLKDLEKAEEEFLKSRQQRKR